MRVELSDKERRHLAARLLEEQRRRFGGRANAAYAAAKVNSATWKRATTHESIKPHSLHDIALNLWPETEGDWRKIPDLGLPEDTYDALLEELERAGFASENREQIRAAIEAARRGEVVRFTGKKQGMA